MYLFRTDDISKKTLIKDLTSILRDHEKFPDWSKNAETVVRFQSKYIISFVSYVIYMLYIYIYIYLLQKIDIYFASVFIYNLNLFRML